MNRELRMALNGELKKYIKTVTMTEEELKALKEWVHDGNSVHSNPSMAVWEGGYPVDFLDVYREEKRIQEELSKLDEEGRRRYIEENFGIFESPKSEGLSLSEQLKAMEGGLL